MNTLTTRNLLYAGFTLILMFVQSGCAGAVQTAPVEALAPAETAMLNTATLIATSTTTDMPIPEATTTFTETPAPTATFTPNVTATRLLEITPAVEGKGNVIGLVLWNNQPVPKAAVWLCEKFQGDCIGTYQYRANTDANGYYLFKNVTPGKYVVAINSFNTSWFIFYFDSSGNKEQTVSGGEDLILEPWNLWKFDLQPVAPKFSAVLSDPHPSFKWEPYPEAVYYRIFIYQYNPFDLVNNTYKVIVDTRVDGNEFIPEETFIACQYFWQVGAYNAQDVKIAEIHPQNQYGDIMRFTNADLPTQC